jgi:hypothetical protein
MSCKRNESSQQGGLTFILALKRPHHIKIPLSKPDNINAKFSVKVL